MNVTEALQRRHSVRAFLDKPVDGALLRELLTLAARAPSGGNLQPWKLHVLGGEPLTVLKAAMATRLGKNPVPDAPAYPIYPDPIPEPHKSARSQLSEAMYGAVGIPREDKLGRMRYVAGNFQCWGAPVALFCYVPKHFGAAQWSDLGMYLQSPMLLLTERGLASCPQEAWSMYHTVVRGQMDVPEDQMLFCGLSIGYEDTTAPVGSLRTARLPLDAFASLKGI